MSSMYMESNLKIYEVDDGLGSIFKVTHELDVDDIVCTCKVVHKKRHTVHTYDIRYAQPETESDSKQVHCQTLVLSKVSLYENEQPGNFAFPKVISDQHFLTELCKSVASVNNNVQLKEHLLSDLQLLSKKFAQLGIHPDNASSQRSLIDDFYSCKIPDQINVGSPVYSVTKGSGVGGRRKSVKEKEIEANNKNLWNCRICNRLVPHDSRNCPQKKS